MTVHVDDLSTSIEAEDGDTGAQDAREGAKWQERDQVTAALARARADRLRTHAAGYDD